MDTTQAITVDRRSIYQGGKRRGFVFDARQGSWSATASSRKAAIAALVAQREYVTQAPQLARGGCKLFAQDVNEWCFVLPSGCAMCFCATDWIAAWERVVADYGTHEDCQGFFTAASK